MFRHDRGYAVSAEKRKSEKGNDYIGCSLSQSKKNQAGEYEKIYMNFFPDDFLRIANLCIQGYNETLKLQQEKTQEKSEGKPEPKQSSLDEELDDEIPF